VLITNPTLVETGLDLNDFTTLFYYNISYNLFSLRQSSRRSWRINQKAPRIEVYFAFYEGTMQHKAIRLMASKLAVAGVIEGNLTDEGLAAMSDVADMTTALARELTNGIQNDVENLSAIFKKMAILKPVSDTASVVDVTDDNEIIGKAVFVDDVPAVLTQITDIAAQSAEIRKISASSSGLLSLLRHNPKPKPTRTPKKKVTAIYENQLSLFDLMDAAV
jgi:hypothetical protein